jgi:quercetin dioxygenase-like cupin family protein
MQSPRFETMMMMSFNSRKKDMNNGTIGVLMVALATAIAVLVQAGQASATPALQTAPAAVATILSRSILDELDVRVKWGTLRSVVETGRNEQAEVVFQHVVAPPGWSGGWHTHPGVVFVTVAEGALTYYHEHEPCQGKIFSKGEGFAEEAHGYDVHIARNEGSTDLDLYLMYVVHKGDALRKDQPAPAGACF